MTEPLADRNTVARHLVATLADAWAQNGDVSLDWEDFPEIGEYDWQAIEKEVGRMAQNFQPPIADVNAALKRLAERATED